MLGPNPSLLSQAYAVNCLSHGSIFHVSQNPSEPHSCVVSIPTEEGSFSFHVMSSALHMANKGKPASSGSTTASAACRILSSPRSVTEVPLPQESMVPRPNPSMKLKGPLTHLSLTLDLKDIYIRIETYCMLGIHEGKTKLKIDTGAKCNVIPHSLYARLARGEHIDSRKRIQLIACGGTKLCTMGQVHLPCRRTESQKWLHAVFSSDGSSSRSTPGFPGRSRFRLHLTERCTQSVNSGQASGHTWCQSTLQRWCPLRTQWCL